MRGLFSSIVVSVDVDPRKGSEFDPVLESELVELDVDLGVELFFFLYFSSRIRVCSKMQ